MPAEGSKQRRAAGHTSAPEALRSLSQPVAATPDRTAVNPAEMTRLKVLHDYAILDTPREEQFDRITSLACTLFNVPVALVTFIDEDRQWMKSAANFDPVEMSRDTAFCSHTIRSDEVLVIPDARSDRRFRANPNVVGGSKIRFYAGAPLIAREGQRLGAVCLIDYVPRPALSPDQEANLKGLAAIVVDELELRRELRIRQQTEAALKEARTAAEAASEAKSEFLATMSHEIRTPLNGVLGYAELLMGGELDPQQTRYVERIQVAGRALLTVVNDILDFSKIEAGQIELLNAPFSVRALIEDTVAIVQAVADAKAIAINVSIGQNVPAYIDGDEARLRQVVLNLLNNAVKFTRGGHVEVIAERAEGDDQRSCMRLSVTDTGIGISRDKQDRLFKRFSQVEGSIGKEFGGTGLGLAISKRLIEAMGGKIWVKSQEGVGSTFSFDVPLTASRNVTLEPLSSVENLPASHARILVADDTEMNQEITTAMLVSAGYDVDIAQDGLEAVNAASTGAYDLILMDVQMPGMDGLAATRRIRELGGLVGLIPIVAITANILPAQINQCRAAGMSDYLSKPYNRADLLQKVRAWLPAVPGPTPFESAQGAETRPDPADFDETTYLEFRALVGAGERMWLSRTREELATFEQRLEAGSPGLVEHAHRLAAQVGMLGLTVLSNTLKELEGASRTGSDVARIRKATAASLVAAHAQIEHLLSVVRE